MIRLLFPPTELAYCISARGGTNVAFHAETSIPKGLQLSASQCAFPGRLRPARGPHWTSAIFCA